MRKNLSLLLALVMAFTVLCGNLGAIAFAEPIGAITEPIEGTVQLESDLYGNSAVGSKKRRWAKGKGIYFSLTGCPKDCIHRSISVSIRRFPGRTSI